MRLPRMVCLALVPWTSIACAEGRVGAAHFELEVGVGEFEGAGIGSGSVFERRIEDINEGRSRSVAFRWHPAAEWTTELRYERANLRYENPENVFCPMSAGILTGNELCRAATYPRPGEIEDRYESVTLLIGGAWEPLERFAVGANVGIARAEWESEGDAAATTLSTCLVESFDPPFRIADCNPIEGKATEVGWVIEANVAWTAARWLRIEAGGHWQDFRYRVYRNEAGPRFCSRNSVSEFGGFCNSLSAFLPGSAFEDGSWSWWYGEAAWAFAEAWELALRGEASGSRDWETLSLALRYRW